MYYIHDEMGELMRVVRRQEEARQILSIYHGWTMTHVRVKRKVIDLSQFEEALI